MHRHAACALLSTALLCACAFPPVPWPRRAAGADAPAADALVAAPRQLTFAGRRTGEGYYGPDGRRLVFQSEREPGNPFYQIYLLDLATGAETRVSTGTGKTTCAWIHPDGRRVLFASTHRDPDAEAKQEAELARRAEGEQRRYAWDYDEHYDLFVRDLDTGALARLTRARGYDAEASFSPDGRRVVFASNRHAWAAPLSAAERERLAEDPSWFVDLYVMDADGANVRRLTTSPGYDGGPFFSPDGERVVWRRFSEDGARAEIHSVRVDGSDARQLTRLGAMSWAPFWHPSGDYLVFSTNLHGFADFELYLVDAEGRRAPVRVTDARGFDGLPAFSPDGGTLAWTRRAPGAPGAQLFRAAWNDARARALLALAPRPADAADAPTAGAPTDGAPTALAEPIRRHVSALAAEEMEGRLTGTPGAERATRYVADAFAALGLVPAGADESWYEPFPFTAGVSLGPGNRLETLGDGAARAWRPDEDWRPLAFSPNAHVPPTEVVFAGYGVVEPERDGEAGETDERWDDYAGLDVRDRWVLVLRYLPEDLPQEARQRLHRYASLRHKAMLARDRGARGLLVASGPRSRFERELVPLRFDGAPAGSSLAAVSVSDALADALLRAGGRRLAEAQAALDRGERAALGPIPGARLAVELDLVRERRAGRNVLGRLASGRPGPPVVVGAHVDHLGRGGGPGSLAREDERDEIHYGADDNASGVAALLAIAGQLADRAARGELALARDVVFAAWSGEELGLLGSSHHVKALAGDDPHGPAPVAAYLNLDMVGRLRDGLLVYGLGTSDAWAREIERAAAPLRLAIEPRADGLLPTDATSFALRGVPVLSVFTGSHAEYHTPRDVPALLNLEGAAEIARLVERLAASLAARGEAPAFASMASPPAGVPRGGLRVYLGTIPDYAAEGVRGLRLAGVMPDGPAEQAGLRAGDVVVEVAGRRVEDIHEYTFALDALRVGEPVVFVVERDGRRRSFRLVPASRE